MTDTEARYIREYLDENPRHLQAAFAVARAWPAVKHDVCRRFLEHLRDRVEERVREEFPEMAGDLDVGCHYGGGQELVELPARLPIRMGAGRGRIGSQIGWANRSDAGMWQGRSDELAMGVCVARRASTT